jgi:sugar/nucleoside kinase (ribokinase family)
MGGMLQCIIYGKIIIDDIRLSDGQIVRRVLGGGGPQAAFGAALWNDSVGLLSRSGTDIEEEHVRTLEGLGVDLSGWRRFPDIPTTRGVMQYDENEYLIGGGVTTSREDWLRLLGQPLTLPPTYREPALIHLITEFADEPMVQTALELRTQGAIFSLEPIIDYREWSNRESILALLPSVDLVTPDWPSASGIAGSDDPREVMRYWAGLGPRLVAVRHGHHGSYVWSREQDEIWHIPAVPVPVVDPTGAGNAYGGGLCAGWLKTGDARLAGVYGAISAAFLVRRYGLPKMTAALRREAHAGLDPTTNSTSRL